MLSTETHLRVRHYPECLHVTDTLVVQSVLNKELYIKDFHGSSWITEVCRQSFSTLFNHYSIPGWRVDSGLERIYSLFFKELRDLKSVQLKSFLSVIEVKALISCD